MVMVFKMIFLSITVKELMIDQDLLLMSFIAMQRFVSFQLLDSKNEEEKLKIKDQMCVSDAFLFSFTHKISQLISASDQ